MVILSKFKFQNALNVPKGQNSNQVLNHILVVLRLEASGTRKLGQKCVVGALIAPFCQRFKTQNVRIL